MARLHLLVHLDGDRGDCDEAARHPAGERPDELVVQRSGAERVLAALAAERVVERPAVIVAGEVGLLLEGAGPQAQLTFKGVPRPGQVPGAPPAEIGSKVAADGTDGRLANGG